MTIVQETMLPEGLDEHGYNALINLTGPDGKIQFEAEQKAIQVYLENTVKKSSPQFPSTEEWLQYLIENEYYDPQVIEQYSRPFVYSLFARARSFGFEHITFLGAFKFYTSYALKSFDGEQYLENFEDRCVMVSLTLARGDEMLAGDFLEEILSGRFQPATPTFLNCGKKQRGEFVSCFLLRMEDNMESISRSFNAALQLSKRGGGVAFLGSNVRAQGDPIKQVLNQSSGVGPVAKIFEDIFSYANQLGARDGAGALYISGHHLDCPRLLDSKRENCDEKIRLKTISLGVVVYDITLELAKNNDDMYLFSPYDVERIYGTPFADINITEKYYEMVDDKRIRKSKIKAREFFQTIAELQMESGYPYILFADNANRSNPISGSITHSNICTEVLQVSSPSTYNEDLSYDKIGQDISCNLGSLCISRVMDSPDFAHTVEIAVKALTVVSDISDIQSVPSIASGNAGSHAIGLGQMDLHGFLASKQIHYGSEEGIDFTNIYFYTILYHVLRTSNSIARERGVTFVGFPESKYASGEFFDKYTEQVWEPKTERVRELFADARVSIPTREDWQQLKVSVREHGIYNRNLQAVAPTGSISYINNSTSSIHPITSKIEIRKEGKIGRVYWPAPHLTNNNLEYFEDAYEIGYEKLIDTYAAATQHVDQGLSLTLFFKDDATTRDLNRAQIYAWRKGIKTIYYVRMRKQAINGTEMAECVSCTL